jgi:hypothetical protein
LILATSSSEGLLSASAAELPSAAAHAAMMRRFMMLFSFLKGHSE